MPSDSRVREGVTLIGMTAARKRERRGGKESGEEKGSAEKATMGHIARERMDQESNGARTGSEKCMRYSNAIHCHVQQRHYDERGCDIDRTIANDKVERNKEKRQKRRKRNRAINNPDACILYATHSY